MIVTAYSATVAKLDKKINELRKHYDVQVVGFSVSGQFAYAMLDVTEMNTWDPAEGEEPYDLPDDPALILS